MASFTIQVEYFSGYTLDFGHLRTMLSRFYKKDKPEGPATEPNSISFVLSYIRCWLSSLSSEQLVAPFNCM